MRVSKADMLAERREQILDAAMVCFVKRGFHETTMQGISEQAGISVGLIYRYFSGKEAVIEAMADEHRHEIDRMLRNAMDAPNLLQALNIFFNTPCRGESQAAVSGFLFDLFAIAARNRKMAELLESTLTTVLDALTLLIARAPEAERLPEGISPRECAEMVLAVQDGDRVRDVIASGKKAGEARENRFLLVGRLYKLLFGVESKAVRKTKSRSTT